MNDDPEHPRRQSVPAARRELLERARNGEITPKEAEDEAARMGMPPLARRPADNQFDPRGKSRWSLSMALGWIVRRDFGVVRQMDNQYRAECWSWQPKSTCLPQDGGEASKLVRWFEVIQMQPINALLFEVYGAVGLLPGDQFLGGPPPDAAKEELWNALSDERLVAEGIPASGGARVDVPAREWADLEVVTDGRLDGEYFRYRHHPNGRAYSNIVWRRENLIQLWPEVSGHRDCARPARKAGTDRDAADFRKWVECRLASGESPPTRADAQSWAGSRNIGVEWARNQHTALPEEMKLARGETPTRRRSNRQ